MDFRNDRMPYASLPASLRAQFESWLGAPVVAAESQPGGFSPGVAARVTAASGRRVFLKAASSTPNPWPPLFHRQERVVAELLPENRWVPPVLWSYDDGDWVAIASACVEGRRPRIPWEQRELRMVIAGLRDLHEALTGTAREAAALPRIETSRVLAEGLWRKVAERQPAGLDVWSARHAERLAEIEAVAGVAARGDTVLHFDLRSDNVLIDGERLWVVDWPHAHIGAGWVDIAFFAPSVAMEGGPSASGVFSLYDRGDAPTDAVLAVVAAIAGFFTWEALDEPVPGLPSLRAFQAAQAQPAREWLAELTGLE